MQRVSTHNETNMDDPQTDPKYQFTHEAIKVALHMITMQPPMVIDYPSHFISDSIQEKQRREWDESLEDGTYVLEYFKPVLYSSFQEQDAIKPAAIGNKRRT